eukprot:GHVU01025242.1.p1 GENE.GHVU01025242.1~~GHVU01025242.1.p1  ORF type:complete len:548 (+),score=82.77 GHVU01025242.1:141-1784(+)
MAPSVLVRYAVSGRSACKTCGKGIPQGSLRLGEKTRSRRRDGFDIGWHHLLCGIGLAGSTIDQLDGWDEVSWEDLRTIASLLKLRLDENDDRVAVRRRRWEPVDKIKALFRSPPSLARSSSSVKLPTTFLTANKIYQVDANRRGYFELEGLFADAAAHGLLPPCPVCGHMSLRETIDRVRCHGWLSGLTPCDFTFLQVNIFSPDKPAGLMGVAAAATVSTTTADHQVAELRGLLSKRSAFVLPEDMQETHPEMAAVLLANKKAPVAAKDDYSGSRGAGADDHHDDANATMLATQLRNEAATASSSRDKKEEHETGREALTTSIGVRTPATPEAPPRAAAASSAQRDPPNSEDFGSEDERLADVPIGQEMTGMKFASLMLPAIRRDSLADVICRHGGTMTGSIDATTTHVITGVRDPRKLRSQSKSVSTCDRLDIPVLHVRSCGRSLSLSFARSLVSIVCLLWSAHVCTRRQTDGQTRTHQTALVAIYPSTSTRPLTHSRPRTPSPTHTPTQSTENEAMDAISLRRNRRKGTTEGRRRSRRRRRGGGG